MEIYILFPANDVALCVIGARVGSVYGGHIVSTAVAVVCERGVNPALFVNINPLWAVHFGGAQQVAGLARFNQNFGLIRKAIGRCERTLAMPSLKSKPWSTHSWFMANKPRLEPSSA